MRSRRRTVDSSLELLLDTICNAFGGVLFIAILVTVLLRISSTHSIEASAPAMQYSELLVTKNEYARLCAAIDELRQINDRQKEIAAAFSHPNRAPLIEQLTNLQDGYLEASGTRAKVLEQIAESKAVIEQVRQESAELDQSLERAGAELDAAQTSLKSQTAASVRAAALPRVRTTSSTEVGIIVRYNRAYLWHRYDRNNERIGLNAKEFVVVSDDGTVVTTLPKPYAGIALDSPDLRRRLASLLKQFNRGRYALCLVVWTDSFETFQQLRSAVVELGFEYRLIPMIDGESMYDRGGVGGVTRRSEPLRPDLAGWLSTKLT